MIVKSGKNIIGFDLCEVGDSADGWDANVGARVFTNSVVPYLLAKEKSNTDKELLSSSSF